MAFMVNFYNFTKRANSTKRPATIYASYRCNILRGSGIMSPTIELNIGSATPPAANYCYIPEFNRYYFVSEWYFNNGIWSANLECDTLATYRDEIGAADLYALRTSNAALYDGAVVDTLYPTKVGVTVDSITVNSPWETIADGCFVIGVTSKNADFGSLKYYICRPSLMQTIVSTLLDNSFLTSQGFSAADASLALQKSLMDPLQYIKSCIFIPVSYADFWAGASENVVIFDWDLGTATATKTVLQSRPYLEKSLTFAITKHPQTTARGNYVNIAPYTTRQLVIPPFGVIPIDSMLTADATTLTAGIRIDFPTGKGILTISAGGMVLNRIETQIGVPVQLSQVTQDILGGIYSIGSAIGSALSGDIGGAVSGIGDAAQSMVPRSQTIGQGGGYTQLTGDCKIEAEFLTVVDDDIQSNGRPCCKVVNPSAGGYFLIQDADVPINGTEAEYNDITSKLENGFYWE